MLPPKATDDLHKHLRHDFLSALTRVHQTLGDVFRIALGKHDLFFVAHPDLAKEVLIQQKDVFAKVGTGGAKTGLQLVLGEGLLTVTHPERWRKSRRMLQPMFHQQALCDWQTHIVQATQALTLRLKEKQEFDIAQEMLVTTAEILYQILFSLTPEVARNYPLVVPLSLATARRKVIREARARLEPVISALITQRRQQRGTYSDVLEWLLEAQDEDVHLTDQNLRDELLTLFAAGHETTSYALAWSFYLLSQYPQVYQRLIGEAKSIAHFSPYAVAIFKEALRLYPTIPAAPRVTLKDTVLNDFEIPKGARVFVSFYLIHRHPEYWPAPTHFNPERFANKDPEAYMPFGLGQRYCLGKHLAMLQGPLVLTQLSKYLRLELSQQTNISPKVVISLFSRYGLQMKILDS